MLENYWQFETQLGCTGIALFRRNSTHFIQMMYKNMLSFHVFIDWEQYQPNHKSSGNDLPCKTISDDTSRPCQDINRTASVSIIRNQNGAKAKPMKNAAARESALSDDVIKTWNGDGDQSPVTRPCLHFPRIITFFRVRIFLWNLAHTYFSCSAFKPGSFRNSCHVQVSWFTP